MGITSSAVRTLDHGLSFLPGQKTARALRVFSAHNITLTLYNKPIDDVYGRLGVKQRISRINKSLGREHLSSKEVSRTIRRLTEENGMLELQYWGLTRIDAAKLSLWSKVVYESSRALVEGKGADKSMHYQFLMDFAAFANQAQSYSEKMFVVMVLFDAMNRHHPPTTVHHQNTRRLAVAIASKMNLPEEEIINIELAATLHDIGKLEMDVPLLNKLGQLDPDDVARIRIHVDFGIDLLGRIKWLPESALDAIRYHHYYKHYPENLKPENAPLSARIIAVGDCHDKMTTPQIYKSGKGVMTPDEAIQDFRTSKYSYDQKAVDTLESLIKSGEV